MATTVSADFPGYYVEARVRVAIKVDTRQKYGNCFQTLKTCHVQHACCAIEIICRQSSLSTNNMGTKQEMSLLNRLVNRHVIFDRHPRHAERMENIIKARFNPLMYAEQLSTDYKPFGLRRQIQIQKG